MTTEKVYVHWISHDGHGHFDTIAGVIEVRNEQGALHLRGEDFAQTYAPGHWVRTTSEVEAAS